MRSKKKTKLCNGCCQQQELCEDKDGPFLTLKHKETPIETNQSQWKCEMRGSVTRVTSDTYSPFTERERHAPSPHTDSMAHQSFHHATRTNYYLACGGLNFDTTRESA